MSTLKDAATSAIPSAGPDFEHLLAQEVVIEATEGEAKTGAQSIEPDHSPRAPLGGASHWKSSPRDVPRAGLVIATGTATTGATSTAVDLQREVEQFLYLQAELLDAKHWQAWIDLFDASGVYWMPVSPEQTEWEGSPSIFAEDKLMMEIRKGRVSHPNAWSQAPMWGTSHIVGNIVIEEQSETQVSVRSRFQMIELHRDTVRHFAGTYRHTLLRVGDDFKIKLQRVDLMNGQAIFDYVLQVWV
jgi:3-phenylpropionate/cinnamic acid dioxygenase small subunit